MFRLWAFGAFCRWPLTFPERRFGSQKEIGHKALAVPSIPTATGGSFREGISVTDYSTALIAAVTAMAGWGGSVITGGFRTRELGKSHKRDDAALMRAKVDELFSELDALQNLASEQIVTAVGVLNRRDVADAKIEKLNLGRIRSLVTLYLPDLAASVAAYDEKCNELIKTLRADLQNTDMDNKTATFGHVVLAAQLTTNLCNELRGLLTEKAGEIGASIRNAK